jgi:gamma-glutamyltranspeptidase
MEDLAKYEAKWKSIHKLKDLNNFDGAISSGGICLAQILIEPYDLSGWGTIQRQPFSIVEAERRAYADRSYFR